MPVEIVTEYIVCATTPKAAAGQQNLWVSLNGLDYVDTGKEFLFYAFAIAKVPLP